LIRIPRLQVTGEIEVDSIGIIQNPPELADRVYRRELSSQTLELFEFSSELITGGLKVSNATYRDLVQTCHGASAIYGEFVRNRQAVERFLTA